MLGVALALAAILLWFAGGSTQAGSAVRGNPSGELSSVSPQPVDPVVVFPAVAPPTVVGGTEFVVEIKADAVQNLAGAQATLTYDPSLLTFVSVQQALGAGCADASNGGTPGILSLAVACTSGHSGAPLTLWKVRFKAALVTQPTPTTLTIQNDGLVLGDASANEIPAVGASTTIVIIPGICGDQNGDGKVNILDAIIDLQIIVGLMRPTPEQLFLSDINRNGRIDVGDVVLTLQHIVGLFRITACGTAIEIDHFPNSAAAITLVKPDGSEETIGLSGPTTVHVFFEGAREGDADDDDGDGLDDSATQIVDMRLSGDSSMGPVLVTLNPAMPSMGEIEETANTQSGRMDLPPFAPAGTANSFFDVFFEVRVGDMPPLHNEQPKTMRSVIDHKPPNPGTGYQNPEIIPLLRPDGQPSGFAIGPASHIPRPLPALDHFKCYNTTGEPENVVVGLRDQFGPDEAMVRQPAFFCNPVAKVHDNRVTPISDPGAHLTFYVIETGRPRPQVIRPVVIRNQFGEQKLEVDGPAFLAVPTQKLPHALPRNLDHFECYKSGGESVNAAVDLRDQFHEEPGTRVLSPVLLCNPVAKLHGNVVTPVRNPRDHLVCYEIAGQPFQTRVETRNQFGPAALPVFNPRWLCAPSQKVAVNTIEIDHFPLSTAAITLIGPDGGEETVHLSGPTTVHVNFEGPMEGDAHDNSGNGLDEVSTQIVQLHLTGDSSMGPVMVTLNPAMPSMGEIEETANTQSGRMDLPPFAPAGTAASFFDVFFEIHVAGTVLHNAEPKRMASLIDHKPPSIGTGYENPNVIPLLDENGRPTGMSLGRATHIPRPPIEVDEFPNSAATIVLSGPEGEETVHLSGPTTVHVFFEGNAEGTADDDDGDGRDEVATRIAAMQLSGESSMGPLLVTLNPAMPSLGEIEERVNTQPGRLDMPPFAETGLADSFFDVFFEIHVAGRVFHTIVPKRMSSVIDHKPPGPGTGYQNPQRIELYDENREPTGMFIGPARHIPNPREVDHFEQTSALVGIRIVDGPFVNMVLSGPATVHVDLASLGDPDGNGREQLNTELVHMTLTDVLGSGAVLRAGSALGLPPSRGQIEEEANLQDGRLDLPGPHPPLCTPADPCPGAQADSFFDVFFEIELPGGTRLRNREPLRIAAVIDRKPPETTYRHVITQPDGIPLVNAEGEVVAFLVTANHSTRPVEIDHFENTSALVGIETPDGDLINMVLRGPATVHVDLRSLHDNPANGREEVSTELAEMTLADVLGSGATLRAGSGHGLPPSVGEIEENENRMSGRLDLPGPDAPFCTPPVAEDCMGTTADSFFDVFFEVDVPGVGTLHNQEPLRVQAVIDEKPPVTTYRHVITQPIVLHDASGQPTGFRLVTAEHSTRPGLDHFKCYTIADPQQPVNAGIGLRDQFGTSNARVMEPFLFCNPAVKLHSDRVTQIEDPNAHLKFYKLETAAEPRTRQVLVSNQFGEQKLQVFHPAFLAVPTQKLPHGKPRNLDHFECYVVQGQPVGQFVSLQDQFHIEPEVEVGNPFLLCNPAVKFHAGAVTPVRNPEDHLVCYEIKGGPFQRTVHARNQFGFETLTTLDPRVFCVPSKKKVIAVEVDHFPESQANIVLIDPEGNEQPIALRGPTTVHVFFDGATEGSADDSDGDGRDEVATQIVQLDLMGESPMGPVHVRLRADMPSMGEIAEQVNNMPGVLDVAPFGDGLADSFFDVFFEVQVGAMPPLHTAQPKRMSTIIDHKPPSPGTGYESPQVIPLLRSDGSPSGFAIGSARHVPTPLPEVGLDHFKCYDIIEGTSPQVTVGLRDQFGRDTAVVLNSDLFCNPVAKMHGNRVTPVQDPDAHLKLYTIQSAAEVKERLVLVANQFGKEQKLHVLSPLFLAVPTQKLPHPFPQGLDHYKCYTVRGEDIATRVHLRDQFHLEQGVPVRHPVFLCNPVEKTHAGAVTPVQRPRDHLVCYKIEAEPFSANVRTRNQFGEERLIVGQPRLLCVPSLKKVIEVDHFPNTSASITLLGPEGFQETIALSGPATIHVTFEGEEGSAQDNDGDGRDEVVSEIVAMKLDGNSPTFGPVTVFLDPDRRSMGEIAEQANTMPGVLDVPPFGEGQADSFFDVFFEVQVGNRVLHAARPKRMRSVIDHKPPGPGTGYQNPDIIPLLDENGRETGFFIGPASHVPNPRPPVEVDTFPETMARVTIINPDGQEEVVHLKGPTTVHVFFEGAAEGDANDNDGDGFDEVKTQIVDMKLSGESRFLGPILVRLNPDMPSTGEIREQANNVPGVLDVAPFGEGQADSFFDVFFEIEAPAANAVVRTERPKRMTAVITHKPPDIGDMYQNPDVIPLVFADGKFSGYSIGSASHTPRPPPEVDFFPESAAEVVLVHPTGFQERVHLKGPTAVHVYFDGTEGKASDTDGDGLDQVRTELVEMRLRGDSTLGPVEVVLNRRMRSFGEIEEQANNTDGVLDVPPFGEGRADSFFDVFFEVTIIIQSGDFQFIRRLHTEQPKRMRSVIDHKPPRPGTGYENPDRIPLLDENGNETGLFIGSARHVPTPPPVEVDIFPNAQAQITVQFGTRLAETIALTGYTEVHVFFEGATEGTANDDDRDQMDEVNAELVSLDMRGFSDNLGEVIVRAGRMLGLPPTMGQIEETSNNTPGILELPPFTRDGRAFSFFDVFFEIEAGGGDFIGRNEKPLPMRAVIRNKPPAPGDEYQSPASVAVEVVDSRTGQSVVVTSASHMPRPPAVIVDIIGVDSCSDGKTLEIHINFSDITDMSQVVGFIHLDTDQSPRTGRPPFDLFGNEAQDIGFDFFLDLFGLPNGVVNVWTADNQLVGTFDALVDGPMVWLFIPLDALGQDDGNVDVTMVLGDFIGPTDWAPDAGHGTARVVTAGCPTIIEDPEGDNLVNDEVPVPQGDAPSGTPEAWKQ
jgi:hypothetical protein